MWLLSLLVLLLLLFVLQNGLGGISVCVFFLFVKVGNIVI